MLRPGRRLALSLFPLAWLTAAAWPAAVTPEIKDDGKFFSAEAVKKANEQIRELYRKAARDLLIETYAAVPADDVEKVKNLQRDERDKYFEKWAKQRVEARVVRGVYVLICKQPQYLYIEYTRDSGFDNATRDRLREIFFSEFRGERYDAGLAAAVRFVQERLGKTPSK